MLSVVGLCGACRKAGSKLREVFDLADLISEAAPGTTTPERVDPFWDSVWSNGATVAWANTDVSSAQERAGLGKMIPAFLRNLDHKECLARVVTFDTQHPARVALMSVLDSYRTVTASQAAAMTGDLTLLNRNSRRLRDMFGCSLLDVGTFNSGVITRALNPQTMLLRPTPSPTFMHQVAPTLTWPELVQATGGYPWNAGGQYDRHNVLASELLLRLAEYAPVGTVMGEKMSSVDLLVGSGLGAKPDHPDNRRGDGLIVRPDGLRIVLEVTANRSKGLETKIRRWCQTIAENPLDTSGLTVLFMVLDRSVGSTDRSVSLTMIRKLVSKVCAEFPGFGEHSVAERIGVIAWSDYFPARHQASDDFLSLRAYFPSGDTAATKWEPKALLDTNEVPFTPWHGFDATAVIKNAAMLGATPSWLKSAHEPSQLGVITRLAAGFDTYPTVTDEQTAQELGAGNGVVVAINAPERLVFPRA